TDSGAPPMLALTYETGTISGYVESEDVRAAINTFMASECACLGLSGDMYGDGAFWGPNQCMDAATAEAACPNPVGNEVGCVALASNPACAGLPIGLLTATDIDAKGGSNYTALSVGLTFHAVPTTIDGVLM